MKKIEFRKAIEKKTRRNRINFLLTEFSSEILFYIRKNYHVRRPCLIAKYRFFFDKKKKRKYISIYWNTIEENLNIRNRLIWLNGANNKPKFKRDSVRKRSYSHA